MNGNKTVLLTLTEAETIRVRLALMYTAQCVRELSETSPTDEEKEENRIEVARYDKLYEKIMAQYTDQMCFEL